MATVTLTSVQKIYADGTHAVRDLSLNVSDGEFVVLVGPSGCGKTTVLRMVAGLEDISEGEIRIGDRVVNDVEPRKRDVAMVFQNYALYPNMTVADNIGFALKMRHESRVEILRRVGEIGEVLGLSELLDRKPGQLSGGQRQRVAMGRAIIRDPNVFLMDEPLSNLDAKLRVQMRSEIARIQRDLGTTTIYVTHDQVEAMTMGTRVAVMRKGELQQVADPRALYDEPANLFVATFIGNPGMNVVEGVIQRTQTGLCCGVGGQLLEIPESVVERQRNVGRYVGRTVGVGIRPEHIRDGSRADGTLGWARLRASVVATEVLGHELLVHAVVQATAVITEEVREVAADVDATTLKALDDEATHQQAEILGRFDPSSDAAPGHTVDVAVDTRAIRFFDLDSGLAV